MSRAKRRELRPEAALLRLSEISAIKADDIVSTLQAPNLIKYCWKRQHMISVSPRVVKEHLGEAARQGLQ